MENYPNPSVFYVPSSTSSPAPLSLDTMNYQSFGREHHGNMDKTSMLFGQTPTTIKKSCFAEAQSEEVKLGSKGRKGEKKVKKPRYAFQTRSQVDILDDGYRWRKYGQKAVKNNKFPRSYYRCTHQGCDVKKQVQRLTKDEEVVVTTYEGMHSHLIEKSTDNFEHILTQMQIYGS